MISNVDCVLCKVTALLLASPLTAVVMVGLLGLVQPVLGRHLLAAFAASRSCQGVVRIRRGGGNAHRFTAVTEGTLRVTLGYCC